MSDRATDAILKGGSLTGRDWHHPNCFGCGASNARGLHADFAFDETSGEVRFEYTVAHDFEGAPGFTHGGILASILDEAQGCLCFHVGHVVMTEKLHLNYHHATPLGQPIQVRAWLTAVRRRRLHTRATLTGKNGELYVSSSASWYVLPERMTRRMFSGHDQLAQLETSRDLLEVNRRRAKEIRRRLSRKGARPGKDEK